MRRCFRSMRRLNRIHARKQSNDATWNRIRDDAQSVKISEPILAPIIDHCIMKRKNLADSIATILADKLSMKSSQSNTFHENFRSIMEKNTTISSLAESDLYAFKERDPATESLIQPLLFYKGFSALQASRIAHQLWIEGRKSYAYFLQSRISEKFNVDIHPAAQIGERVMIDHATGIVIGETAIIGDDCSILHNVTLGGNGKDIGDRHPKVGRGVLIGAGAKILGNISVGDYSVVGAGSVVLKAIPIRTTVAGVPAKIIGKTISRRPSQNMNLLSEINNREH